MNLLIKLIGLAAQLILAVFVFIVAAWLYFLVASSFSFSPYATSLAVLALLSAFLGLVFFERFGLPLDPRWSMAAAWSLIFFSAYSIKLEIERLAAAGLTSAATVLQNAVGCSVPIFGRCGPSLYFDLFREMDWALGLASMLSITIAILYSSNRYDILSSSRRKATKEAYGTARWLSLHQAKEMFGRGDIVVGQEYEGDPDSDLYRFDGSGHLITIAGSGAGKTTSVAIPNSLSWPGNLVVIDPKGEVASQCAAERARAGRNVIIIDPMDEIGPPELRGSINVLDWIDPTSKSVVNNVDAVVDWLAPEDATHGDNAIFNDQAKTLIKVVILSVICERHDPLLISERTLRAVRSRITSPNFSTMLKSMVEEPDRFYFGKELSEMASGLVNVQVSPRTWAGVLLHAHQILAWLSSPSLAPTVCATSGVKHPQTVELIHGKMDVFVCVPIKTLDSNPSVARLILGALLNTVYEHGRKCGHFDEKTLFILDEMPRLKHMKLLETARDASRGLGAVIWAIIQDLGQLEKYYQPTGVRSWMESCTVRTFFGISDIYTAEYISKSLGTKTEEIEEASSVRGISSSIRGVWGIPSRSKTVTRRVVSRPLLTPGEVMQLKADGNGVPSEQVIFRRNSPPLRCGIVRWYERREFKDIIE